MELREAKVIILGYRTKVRLARFREEGRGGRGQGRKEGEPERCVYHGAKEMGRLGQVEVDVSNLALEAGESKLRLIIGTSIRERAPGASDDCGWSVLLQNTAGVCVCVFITGEGKSQNKGKQIWSYEERR